jgi:hypothetical protein
MLATFIPHLLEYKSAGTISQGRRWVNHASAPALAGAQRKYRMNPLRLYVNVARQRVGSRCNSFLAEAASCRDGVEAKSPTRHNREAGADFRNLSSMKPGLGPIRMRTFDVTPLLLRMKLAAAISILRLGRGEFDSAAVAAMISEHQSQARRLHAAGEIGAARRMARRAAALRGLLVHGPDPRRMVAEVELPEGYHGKIMLVRLTGGGFADTVCLRSGDGWHREILTNTRAELKDLGFLKTLVDPLGGAYARFELDGSIAIWGTSDEYGCCDKEEASRMIARTYPERPVRIDQELRDS